jgi:hypothetical protein
MMDQQQKDAMFALGFMDGKAGKPMLEDPNDCSPATTEYRKGHQAGTAAAKRRANSESAA